MNSNYPGILKSLRAQTMSRKKPQLFPHVMAMNCAVAAALISMKVRASHRRIAGAAKRYATPAFPRPDSIRGHRVTGGDGTNASLLLRHRLCASDLIPRAKHGNRTLQRSGLSDCCSIWHSTGFAKSRAALTIEVFFVRAALSHRFRPRDAPVVRR